MVTRVAVCALLVTARLGAQQPETFRGEIIDSICAGATRHAPKLKPRETSASCTVACVKKGAKYVLFNPENGTIYQLDDQATPKDFAAQNVVVIGTLDRLTGTIQVFNMIRALPPKVTQATSVYVDCDGCAKEMVKAKQAALQELLNWQRFTVTADPREADLILVFSANPYRGDYITRDAPDKRPISADILYMDVVDPATGASLWSDSKASGYMFVKSTMKAMITQFRGELETQQGQLQHLLRRDTPTASPSVGK
jgi:hypothetical protein